LIGLVLAPTDFGSFSHKLIVGQFGSGEILAFDAITGRFEGKLRDQNDNVIVLPGLWGISFGAGQPSPQNSGPANALFFNAGINQGMGGLFGNLTPVSSDLYNPRGRSVAKLYSKTRLQRLRNISDRNPRAARCDPSSGRTEPVPLISLRFEDDHEDGDEGDSVAAMPC
jgi:hypothetical protein